MSKQQVALKIKANANNQASASFRTGEKQERLYYFDWLRVLAVLVVFFAHMAWVFDVLYSWKIENLKAYALLVFGTQTGMALFFLIAGANAWFSLRSRTGRQFLGERVARLAIPFLAATILLAPFQGYFLDLSRSLFHGSFLEYCLHFVKTSQLSLNPLSLSAFGFHLWFLAFLFLFSLLALPLFIFLKHETGQHFITWLVALCERRRGIFILSLPLVVIQATLRASFPGYQGWTDFFVWFVFFVYGYLFLADRRFEQAVQKNGMFALLVGIASFLIIVATMYGPAFMNFWQVTPGYSLIYALYQLLFSITAWSLIIFVLYFAKRFLNFDNKFIRYANQALLPFFLLHFLMIVIITYLFVPWDMNMAARFLLVSALALAATLAVYELLIKRIGITRRLFGMKPDKQEHLHSIDMNAP